MQNVTVAIADVDRDRRAGYERLLYGEDGITLLSNVGSSNEDRNDHAFVNRRVKQRTDVLAYENEVARIKRLKPSVMLVNLDLSDDEGHALLLSLRCECPETYIVLLTDEICPGKQAYSSSGNRSARLSFNRDCRVASLKSRSSSWPWRGLDSAQDAGQYHGSCAELVQCFALGNT